MTSKNSSKKNDLIPVEWHWGKNERDISVLAKEVWDSISHEKTDEQIAKKTKKLIADMESRLSGKTVTGRMVTASDLKNLYGQDVSKDAEEKAFGHSSNQGKTGYEAAMQISLTHRIMKLQDGIQKAGLPRGFEVFAKGRDDDPGKTAGTRRGGKKGDRVSAVSPYQGATDFVSGRGLTGGQRVGMAGVQIANAIVGGLLGSSPTGRGPLGWAAERISGGTAEQRSKAAKKAKEAADKDTYGKQFENQGLSAFQDKMRAQHQASLENHYLTNGGNASDLNNYNKYLEGLKAIPHSSGATGLTAYDEHPDVIARKTSQDAYVEAQSEAAKKHWASGRESDPNVDSWSHRRWTGRTDGFDSSPDRSLLDSHINNFINPAP